MNRYQELASKNETELTFKEFCDKLKEDGAYIGEDWHIYRKDGRPLSRRCSNGYYLVRKMYNNHTYHFCEHRVIWYWINGEFDETLTINHKDFDRENNNIDNLELLTISENLKYTRDAGRSNWASGEDSGKAIFTNDEVKAMRYLYEKGYKISQIQKMFGVKWGNTIGRLVKGTRYGKVPNAKDVIEVYPFIVDRTWRNDLPKEERIKNALFGLSGEIGELLDIYKKEFFHNHESDDVHKMLELGDILYYATALCNELGLNFSEVMYANMDKLSNRYPEGFEVNRSLNRMEGDI